MRLFSDVTDPKDLLGVEVRISFWNKDKWKKNKLLGEITESLHVFLRNAKASDVPGQSVIEFQLENYKKKKKEGTTEPPTVTLLFEMTGWKITYDLLSEKQTVQQGISNILATTDPKSSIFHCSYTILIFI